MKSSSDVWFCAFVRSRGYELHSYQVIARGKVKCDFVISDAEWMTLKVEFSNSELSKFKGLIEQVKDLAY